MNFNQAEEHHKQMTELIDEIKTNGHKIISIGHTQIEIKERNGKIRILNV